MSSTIVLSVMPIGTSIKPMFTRSPARAKTLVPVLFGVPIDANHSAPLLMIAGMLARVSTLLIIVGLPQSPLSVG